MQIYKYSERNKDINKSANANIDSTYHLSQPSNLELDKREYSIAD